MTKQEIIRKHFSEMGKKSYEARKKKYGPDHWKFIRLQGAKSRKKEVIHI